MVKKSYAQKLSELYSKFYSTLENNGLIEKIPENKKYFKKFLQRTSEDVSRLRLVSKESINENDKIYIRGFFNLIDILKYIASNIEQDNITVADIDGYITKINDNHL